MGKKIHGTPNDPRHLERGAAGHEKAPRSHRERGAADRLAKRNPLQGPVKDDAAGAAIEVKDLSFSYDRMPVLEDVTFSVERGRFYSVVGPNGGGKTTLLRLLMGLLKPTKGWVRVLGRSPERVRERIGYMPQHTHFDPSFPVTVLDVVLMGRLGFRWGGPYTRDDRKAACEALEVVGGEGLEDRPFSLLSGGQRQRVLLARAMVGKPLILFLDEPTANVDMVVETRLMEILKELNRRMTILLVTHDLGFVEPIVESCICVNRRVAVHPTCRVNEDIIQNLYGTQMRVVRHDTHQEEKGNISREEK